MQRNAWLILTFLLVLAGCKTEDSVDIADQSDIYGVYKINYLKGSSKLKAQATFYEKGSGVHDHVALRGGSFVTFQGQQMQEVRDFWDLTHYEALIVERSGFQTGHRFTFEYQNNDEQVQVVDLVLPEFISALKESIKIKRRNGKVTFSVDWTYDNPNPKKKGQNVYLILNEAGSEYRPDLLKRSPLKVRMEETEFDRYDAFQICTETRKGRSRSIHVCGAKIYL